MHRLQEVSTPPAKSIAPESQGLLDRLERRLEGVTAPFSALIATHEVAFARYRAIRMALGWVIGLGFSSLFFISATIGLMIIASFYLSPEVAEVTLPKDNLKGLAILALIGWILVRIVLLLNSDGSDDVLSRVVKTWRGERRYVVWKSRSRQ
ncbi:MAG: hypothetical protein F8N36_16040 [Desulfovibrio sp.]|uniref:hypothetical protein n=1 Tax=Desulfovibrio sp. TaxID=885 RepID=UPI00135E5318|nr:hypothetical protein [Desulfovibrio sp.]MTJ94350.1 hypothetical protein [Desulfovibrio sp.]